MLVSSVLGSRGGQLLPVGNVGHERNSSTIIGLLHGRLFCLDTYPYISRCGKGQIYGGRFSWPNVQETAQLRTTQPRIRSTALRTLESFKSFLSYA